MASPRVRTALLWTLAVAVTLASAAWQRRTGPTYPVSGAATLGGTAIAMKLTRSHAGDGDQPVVVNVADRGVTGTIAWRRFPTTDPYATIAMTRRGDALEGALPHQPPAGKLEYQVRLQRGTATVVFPQRPAVTRFKGDVAAPVLVPHVLAMFLSMLFSNRAALDALAGRDAKRFAWTTTILLAAGGFVLGPIIQKQAFGAYWTGIPFGYDLTDNKTLFAGIAWAAALFFLRGAAGGRRGRIAVIAAAVVMLVVFAIPHSTWGSQIAWESLPATP